MDQSVTNPLPRVVLVLAASAAAISFAVHVPSLVDTGSRAFGFTYAIAFPILLGLCVVLGGAALVRGGATALASIGIAYVLLASAFINWIFHLWPLIRAMHQ